MADNTVDEHFVEAISNVSHANGVFRVTLGRQDTEDAVTPVTRLMIPANQLGRLLQGIGNAANEIGERVREKADTTDDDGAAEKDKK